VKKVYASVGHEYFENFSTNPRDLDQTLWESVRQSKNVLAETEEAFGLTTAPAFSDWINDEQPPWTDVTYWRYDMAANAHYAAKVPFVLFDTIKHNVFPPNSPNAELYRYIAGIIPHYQDMGIEGARIDMAHALPAELLASIRNAAREKNPEFILWSEEFSAGNSAAAKKSGFDMISGNTWYLFPRIMEKKSWRGMVSGLLASKLPVTAALETPDTPRIALRYSGKQLELMHVMAAVLPNCSMFINAGQELGEIQPMNLGLDNTEQGRFVLPENDPLYGRLAFFDAFAPRYDSGIRLNECIEKAVKLRSKYADLIKNGKCTYGRRGELFYLGYRLRAQHVCFVFNLGECSKNFYKKPFTDKRITVDGGTYEVIGNK
jgi:hypothetical protein